MSMSTFVVGIRPIDDRWRAMKAVYDACKAAKVGLPDEVFEFFSVDDDEPDEAGPIVSLYQHPSVAEWSDSERAESGLVVDLRMLPEGITHLRFFNSF